MGEDVLQEKVMFNAIRPGLATLVCTAALVAGVHARAAEPAGLKDAMEKLKVELSATLAPEERPRLARGLTQVARFWRETDGDAAAFEAFVREHFARDQTSRDAIFGRFERLLEQIDGHAVELGRELRSQSDLDLGPILPVDELFAGYDPGAHVLDDFFQNKLAFVVLLNFPLTTLDERLAQGPGWTRREWAEARLAQRFSKRIPAAVGLELARVTAEAEQYVAEYNIWAHHLVDAAGRRLFPARLRLLSHWNLRDQIKADYADRQEGLTRQRQLQKVMERIVTQTIPAVVVDNPAVDWNPVTNEVRASSVQDADSPRPQTGAVAATREPDTRYATLLATYRAARQVDPYSPTAPSLIARRFDEGREIPEARVRAMLESLLSSPSFPRVARLIKSRLGRPLEPFDIWYNGFLPRSSHTEAQLDELVRRRYPTSQAFEADIPNILERLGFTRERAQLIASRIAVDPARGSGHALGASMRSARARLRTRVGAGGMDYKGYNIALHELGHNVEQTISLYDIDHWLLAGVPNTAFTEAFAFVFQAHDMDLLGVAVSDERSQALRTLNQYWMTCEIAAVALVDMGIWHWMYDHPDATPAELREATLAIARDVWNRYFAAFLGARDVPLLAIYSHILSNYLYIPDYPIGHLIAFQIENKMRAAGSVGAEFERMARLGVVAPDLWMQQATGTPVGSEALLDATARALSEVKAPR
jgi:hypothetical protein